MPPVFKAGDRVRLKAGHRHVTRYKAGETGTIEKVFSSTTLGAAGGYTVQLDSSSDRTVIPYFYASELEAVT
jgi:hypothetical protein